MAKPKRTFSGQEGQRSVGTAGPEGISYDLDNLFAALDPDDIFKDGTPGGVGEENLRTDSISDRALGERTVDQSESPSSNTGLLTNVLSWFGNMIKKITGETNWFDTPATTLKAAKTHIDANAPHSGHINAINNIQGGNITLKAGTNVEISQNTATKEVTIATSGTIAPSAHASSHGSSGADQITPASIGAAASTHTHTPASIGAVPAVSGKGLSTNDFTTALLNKLNGIDEGAQVNRPISSQAQAQDGTDNSTVMTPLRVKEAINKTVVTGEYTGNGAKDRDINIGFQPKVVFIIRLNSDDEFIVIGGTDRGVLISSVATTTVKGTTTLQTTANGFHVGGTQAYGQYGNVSGANYFWIAFP